MQHISAILFYCRSNFFIQQAFTIKIFHCCTDRIQICRKTSSLNIVGFLKDGNFVVDKVPTFLYYLLVKNIVLFYN